MKSCRIASLLPAGTEIVAALGAQDQLVGISHECDYPASVSTLPRLTASPIDSSASSGSIDRQVRTLRAAGRPVIEVDGRLLQESRPDLILTQGLCEVCAVVEGDVRSLAQLLSPVPMVLPLAARTLPGIFEDIAGIGAAIGRELQATELVGSLERRLGALRVAATTPPPRVTVIEWLDPLYLAGHWVPEMVSWAGGRDVGAAPGDHSRVREWEELAELAPDLVILALCGFDLDRAIAEWQHFLSGRTIAAAAATNPGVPIWAIDGNAYTSRPGPRTVDGVELIQSALRGKASAEVVRLR